MSDDIFYRKLADLISASERKGIFTFTPFLGLPEKNMLLELIDREARQGHHIPFTLYGGYEEAERVMCRFGSADELGYEQEFPIAQVVIRPLNGRFAEKLCHRDYLGSILNLGITRASVGDIICCDDKSHVFIAGNLAEMITNELIRIKHTSVALTVTEEEITETKKDVTEMQVSVASERLDVLIGAVYKKSRNESAGLIKGCRVYVNGRECIDPSRNLKEGDVVNLRGSGKFTYLGKLGEIKKGRLAVLVRLYN